MADLSKRNFGRQAFKFGGALSVLALLNVPQTARAFFDKVQKDKFLQRKDLEHAIKSYYMTYNCTSPYPHKFNEVLVKTQMRSLQFMIDNGLEKGYVDHYITTLSPILERIKMLVQKEGAEKGLYSMFEGTSCSYQLFEHINVSPGVRTFPCPYKEILGYCKKYLGTFTINWGDVCSKWCKPTWSRSAEKIGIKIRIKTGETCSVQLLQPAAPEQKPTA